VILGEALELIQEISDVVLYFISKRVKYLGGIKFKSSCKTPSNRLLY
jgi:hypothetical protein